MMFECDGDSLGWYERGKYMLNEKLEGEYRKHYRKGGWPVGTKFFDSQGKELTEIECLAKFDEAYRADPGVVEQKVEIKILPKVVNLVPKNSPTRLIRGAR